MPTPKPMPDFLRDVAALASWPIPADLRLVIVFRPPGGDVRFSLCRAARPEFRLTRLPEGLRESEVHDLLDRLAAEVRAAPAPVPVTDPVTDPGGFRARLDEAGSAFHRNLAGAMARWPEARGGSKSGDDDPDGDDDADGCTGKGGSR